ncbi:MAG: VTT domain-containing protein [Candidatus Riflebacteria bacterium]|nr:VTT domain-containing protein [Candidatus Riflebacteria bacterium]
MIDLIHSFFQNLYNLEELIRWGGMTVLLIIVFSETGLLIGFFLPGDSLLVVAGVLAAGGFLDIWWLNISLMLAAILGDAVGYQIGLRTGPKIFKREDSLLFRRSHLLRTHEFYERHGGKTIILARFIPVIRTFAPVVAGVGTMGYWRIATYNIVGGIGWVASMTLSGYFLGRLDPHIKEHIHYVVAIVIFLSILPGAVPIARSYLESWRAKRKGCGQAPAPSGDGPPAASGELPVEAPAPETDR